MLRLCDGPAAGMSVHLVGHERVRIERFPARVAHGAVALFDTCDMGLGQAAPVSGAMADDNNPRPDKRRRPSAGAC
jgi:hypothetical protein